MICFLVSKRKNVNKDIYSTQWLADIPFFRKIKKKKSTFLSMDGANFNNRITHFQQTKQNLIQLDYTPYYHSTYGFTAFLTPN